MKMICSICKKRIKKCEICGNNFESWVYCYKDRNTYKHFCCQTCFESYVYKKIARGIVEVE